MTDPASTPPKLTPLHVLTGFLGSGKTTLLRRVLATTRRRVAVLVNEVADLPIDARLLAGYDEEVLALPGGCICCTMRDDLHETLAQLCAHRPDLIVLETSGMADPAAVLGSLTADPRFAAVVRLAGVTCVVDCERADQLFDVEPEALRQLEPCDRIVISKSDLAPHRLAAVQERLAAAAPGREVHVLQPDDDDFAWLFAPPSIDVSALHWLAPRPSKSTTATANTPTGHGALTTHSLRTERPVDIDALQLWLRLATQLDGERLLRIKAIARCARDGGAFALQSAGRSVAPPLRLAHAPNEVQGAEIVLIERGLPQRACVQLLTALRQALAQPDLTTLA